MNKWFWTVIIVLLSTLTHASGPVLPDRYRLPTTDELKADWRSENANRYAEFTADLNGDNLVDGCFLAIDKRQNKLVLLAVLCFDDADKWLLLDTMNIDALQYMGVEKVEPSTVMVYPPKEGNTKTPKQLKNSAIKLFASEGSSSVFYWNGKAKKFLKLWLTK